MSKLRITLIVIGSAVGLFLLGWGVFGVKVLLSNVAGAGGAVQIKNNATNRIQAQAQFHQAFSDINSYTVRLRDAQMNVDAFNKQHPGYAGNGSPYDPIAQQLNNLQTTVQGIQQECLKAATDYNASTEIYTLADFRDADLPYKIAVTDPVFMNGQYSWSDYNCSTNPQAQSLGGS